MKCFSKTDIGLKRSENQDRVWTEMLDEDAVAVILCDGMGGHAAGEVASGTVCKAMSQYILSHLPEDGIFEEEDFSAALESGYSALDEKDTNDEKKMGTTLAFVMFHQGGCFVAHIGDSRVYHIRPSENKVLFVTRDHSLVNDLVELGEMTREEAKTSNRKNIITRAMQPHQDHQVQADCVNLTDLKQGDYLYLCSDGMLEQMDDQEVVTILSLHKSDFEKIQILKGATKDNRDNHSAHLIHITSVGSKREASPWRKIISSLKRGYLCSKTQKCFQDD